MTQDKIVKEKIILLNIYKVYKREFAQSKHLKLVNIVNTVFEHFYFHTGAFKKQKKNDYNSLVYFEHIKFTVFNIFFFIFSKFFQYFLYLEGELCQP